MPRAVPRVRAVLCIVDQRLEERRRQAVHVTLGLADDVARHELRRVFEHVNEAVQLAKNIVRQVLRRARFTIQIDRHLGVLEAHFFDELAQVQYRRVELGAGCELFVVDRQDERAGAALLLRELAQVAVGRGAQHLEALFFNRTGQRTNAQARGVFGAKVFVDDDDRKVEAQHGQT